MKGHMRTLLLTLTAATALAIPAASTAGSSVSTTTVSAASTASPAASIPVRPAIRFVVCGGSCDPGAILPPCTAALAGYVGWVVYGNSPTKSQFRCNGRGTWVYEGEVPR